MSSKKAIGVLTVVAIMACVAKALNENNGYDKFEAMLEKKKANREVNKAYKEKVKQLDKERRNQNSICVAAIAETVAETIKDSVMQAANTIKWEAKRQAAEIKSNNAEFRHNVVKAAENRDEQIKKYDEQFGFENLDDVFNFSEYDSSSGFSGFDTVLKVDDNPKNICDRCIYDREGKEAVAKCSEFVESQCGDCRKKCERGKLPCPNEEKASVQDKMKKFFAEDEKESEIASVDSLTGEDSLGDAEQQI